MSSASLPFQITSNQQATPGYTATSGGHEYDYSSPCTDVSMQHSSDSNFHQPQEQLEKQNQVLPPASTLSFGACSNLVGQPFFPTL